MMGFFHEDALATLKILVRRVNLFLDVAEDSAEYVAEYAHVILLLDTFTNQIPKGKSIFKCTTSSLPRL